VADLTTASRAELLGLIAAQAATIAELRAANEQLRAEVRELRARLDKGGPRGMPGLKPPSAHARAPRRPRKGRQHGFGRGREAPTRRVRHVVAACPSCATPLRGGAVVRRRQVIEVAPVAFEVTEHLTVARRCPGCGRRVVPRVDLGGQAVGRQRLGLGLVSLIAVLREELRLPVRAIRGYLATVHGLRLSVGAIVAAGRAVAERGRAEVERIRARVRAGPVVHADETGWREDGVNGYVWTFSTPTERYFVHGRRDKGMVDAALGAEFGGVLVSDFYAAYHHYAGLHQRCWAHLLREIHELRELHPADAALRAWAAGVHALYAEAVAFAGPDGRARARAARRFEDRLLARCRPFLAAEAAPQRRLCARIARHLAELFVFVAHPEVPPDNNAAERSLRHLVTSRKISGGTRSDAGTATKMALATLFGTWRAQGRNPLHACHHLLAVPQL
jgi:transposase